MLSKKMVGLGCGLILVLLFCSWFGTAIPATQASTTTQIIVAFKHSADVADLAAKFKIKNYKPLKVSGLYLMELPDEVNLTLAVTQLNLDRRVRYAEPNYRVQFHENSNYFGFDGNGINFDPGSLEGTDLKSSVEAKNKAINQWAWQRTNLVKAQQFNQGQGVKVAVMDSGVNYNHPDFDNTVVPGWSPIDGKDGMDTSGHGTYVAGIIHQVAPQAIILPVRVLDNAGVGTISNIVEGSYWAYEQGATIINFSFSSTLYSQTLSDVVRDLTAKNVVMIASAGNNNSDIPTFPAALSPVVAVGAIDQHDNKANFSNFGPYVDVSAPGVGIYSYYWKGGYAWADGTSFAAPMLAGAAALYEAHYPYQPAFQLKYILARAVDIFPTTCKVLSLSCFGQLGTGRLDFAKLF